MSLSHGCRRVTQGMSLEFPFEYADTQDLGRLFYPVIIAEVKTVVGWRAFEFLVDTGADVTTVPLQMLSVLGLKKTQLSANTTLGVGGISVKTWEFQMSIRLGVKATDIRCSAVDVKNDSMPLLLGRKDLFEERYSLLVDSKRKVTVISENIF